MIKEEYLKHVHFHQIHTTEIQVMSGIHNHSSTATQLFRNFVFFFVFALVSLKQCLILTVERGSDKPWILHNSRKILF